MNKNMIFETLKQLSDNQRKKESKDNFDQHSKRKDPSYIYLDEKDNQIKEISLSKLDSAAVPRQLREYGLTFIRL